MKVRKFKTNVAELTSIKKCQSLIANRVRVYRERKIKTLSKIKKKHHVSNTLAATFKCGNGN